MAMSADVPYSYAAEQMLSQALVEKEPSFEELEAAIKETTPSRPSMQLTHGRNNSEPRALGDVIDESEKMLPLGSPGLRHTKGRLENSTKHSHRPTTPSTPHLHKENTSPSTVESYAAIVQHEPTSPSIRAANFSRRELGRDPKQETDTMDNDHGESYADIVKHAPSGGEPGVVKHEEDESYADIVKHDAKDHSNDIRKEEVSAKDVNTTATIKQESSSSDVAQTQGDSYAAVVSQQPTSPTQADAEIAQDKPKHEEDFADTATAVSDDDASQSFSGVGKDESPRSPHKKAHRRQSSRSLNGTSGKILQAHNDDAKDAPPGTLVSENYHTESGTNLTSVVLEPEFDLSLSQRKNKDITSEPPEERAKAEKSTLVSGRRAGAGWARSAIRWAPLNVPLQRRLQTLAVLAHSLSIAGLLAFFFLLCAIPIFWPVLLPYLIYVLLSKAPTDGKLTYRSEWIRRSKFWSLFASYFPARLHRTVELEPTRKYIFGYHPHGIISHGAFAAFTTEALGFAQLFPGITNTLLTLDSNFRVPLYRDWALRLGLASVSRESCENLLSKGGPNGEGMGRAITIVIGGARESLDAIPGTLNLVLAKRKGFVKLAVRTGADLVPVLAFGENDMYEQITSETHPWIHKTQLLLKKFMGFTVPLFHARGIFNYDVGIMPYRRPVNIVVGRPIKTVQNKKPDTEYVDKLHKEYTDQLLHIWDEWKDVFAPQRNCELQIVE